MYLAIDIGGTKIAAALVDGVSILDRREAASPIHDDISRLAPLLVELCDDWGRDVRGVGIASTGLVTKDYVHFLSVGPDAKVPVAAQLETRWKRPVLVLNDAWSAAWGEYMAGGHEAAGPDRPSQSMGYVTLSTGVGGGFIHAGRLITSPSGFAAHVGHMAVPVEQAAYAERCACGRWNCLETLVSGTAIARKASEIAGASLSARTALEAGAADPALDAYLDHCARMVAAMTANLKALFDMPLLVIGGSVGLSEAFRRRMTKALDALPPMYRLEVTSPRLGRDADLIGAALAARDGVSR